MDIKTYFKKVRQVESTILTTCVVIASLETSDGGKVGSFTEVSKGLAARMITEGRGRLASEEETALFFETHAEARRSAEALAMAQKMQFTLVHPVDNRHKPVRGPKE
jgi:hypothetical protein